MGASGASSTNTRLCPFIWMAACGPPLTSSRKRRINVATRRRARAKINGETQIRPFIEDWCDALRTRHLAQLMQHLRARRVLLSMPCPPINTAVPPVCLMTASCPTKVHPSAKTPFALVDYGEWQPEVTTVILARRST